MGEFCVFHSWTQMCLIRAQSTKLTYSYPQIHTREQFFSQAVAKIISWLLGSNAKDRSLHMNFEHVFNGHIICPRRAQSTKSVPGDKTLMKVQPILIFKHPHFDLQLVIIACSISHHFFSKWTIICL